MMSRGQRIQKLRADASLSQEAFASMLGVSRQSVSKWEQDKAFPDMDKLALICEKFGVSCDWLILGEEILEEEPDAQEKQNTVTITKKAYIALLLSACISSLAALGMCVYVLLSLIN